MKKNGDFFSHFANSHMATFRERSHVYKFLRIILKCGNDIDGPMISDKFNYGGSASLNMRIMDHLMRWTILDFLYSFVKV